MARNKGKPTFWLVAVMTTLLIYCAAFAQPPQSKMDRAIEELRQLRKKVKEMEEKEEGILGKILRRVELHGLLEVEASYTGTHYRGHPIDKSLSGTENARDSDIVLATAELGIDIDFHKYAKGHVLFLWEEDETEPVDLDEGTITLGGRRIFPSFSSVESSTFPSGCSTATLSLIPSRWNSGRPGKVRSWLDLPMTYSN